MSLDFFTKTKAKAFIAGAIKSWTVWFNAVGIPILMYLEANSALWQEYAGGNTNLIIIIMNLVLRVKTKSSLSEG